ncbi:MAG: ABC transporter substrate-binding protein, partial [Spirochaetia bacterium]|nr:ABC transporter substrate-binding protein [Spirochaetia bacterium]
ITAEVLGTDKKKEGAILQEWEDVKKEIAEKTSPIPDEKKKKILIVFKANGNMVAGGNSFGQYWIASTGGINCADEITANHPAMVKIADFEQVLKWDPDIVYLTNFADTMPEDIYENRIQGQDWSETAAVKNKAVYKIPLGNYRWYPPSLDGPLMLKWMAVKNYPDIFKWDMKSEIREYYKKYFNYPLTDGEIHSILNPASSGNF